MTKKVVRRPTLKEQAAIDRCTERIRAIVDDESPAVALTALTMITAFYMGVSYNSPSQIAEQKIDDVLAMIKRDALAIIREFPPELTDSFDGDETSTRH